MLTLDFLSPTDVSRRLADRGRALRVACNLSREELGERSGLSVGTIRRFEAGKPVSLDNFLRIVEGLGRIRDLEKVLEGAPAMSISQLEKLEQASQRKRAYKRRQAST
jgi:transcriptional regulator with XRE-family HTH domain